MEARIARHDPSLVHAVLASPVEPLPTTRFLRTGDIHLAYQEVGTGPPDVVLVPGFTGHVELRWEDPDLTHLYKRLARSARLVLFDKRGTGMSDRQAGVPPLADQVADVVAVMDTTGVERAVLFGVLDGAAVALAATAAHPERVAAVVTWSGFPVLSAPEYPHGMTREATELAARVIEGGLVMEDAIPAWAPSRVGDDGFARRFNRLIRMGAGVGGAAAVFARMQEIDIRQVVPNVRVPVLVLHREGDTAVGPANARWLAEHLPVAECVLLPGIDNVVWAAGVDDVVEEIERFLERVAPALGSSDLIPSPSISTNRP